MSDPASPVSVLPSLYARWMEAALEDEIPPEQVATCDDCAMCIKPGRPLLPSDYSFNPDTKCCTYAPELPNFTVGRILADTSPGSAEGRRRVEARLGDSMAATPLGLGRPPGYLVAYRQLADKSFGKNRALLCPYYLDTDGGRCGIWRYREALCATWFCKFNRGAVGQRFWKRLHQLLANAERAVAIHCVAQLDIGAEALERLFVARPRADHTDWLENLGELEGGAALWGRWEGRTADFYRGCAEIVERLTWSDVLALGGAELDVLLRLSREAFADLQSQEVPAELAVGQLRLVQLGETIGHFCTYSGFDSLEMPMRMLDVLHHFNGRTVDEALHEVYMDAGVDLRPHVRQLMDYEVLIPVERTLPRRPRR